MATGADDAGRCIVPADYLLPSLGCDGCAPGRMIIRFTQRAHPSRQRSWVDQHQHQHRAWQRLSARYEQGDLMLLQPMPSDFSSLANAVSSKVTLHRSAIRSIRIPYGTVTLLPPGSTPALASVTAPLPYVTPGRYPRAPCLCQRPFWRSCVAFCCRLRAGRNLSRRLLAAPPAACLPLLCPVRPA